MRTTRYFMVREIGTENYVVHRGGMGELTTKVSNRHVFDSQRKSREVTVADLKNTIKKDLEAVNW